MTAATCLECFNKAVRLLSHPPGFVGPCITFSGCEALMPAWKKQRGCLPRVESLVEIGGTAGRVLRLLF